MFSMQPVLSVNAMAKAKLAIQRFIRFINFPILDKSSLSRSAIFQVCDSARDILPAWQSSASLLDWPSALIWQPALVPGAPITAKQAKNPRCKYIYRYGEESGTAV
jgi:hypothetical protein